MQGAEQEQRGIKKMVICFWKEGRLSGEGDRNEAPGTMDEAGE